MDDVTPRAGDDGGGHDGWRMEHDGRIQTGWFVRALGALVPRRGEGERRRGELAEETQEKRASARV